MLTMPVFTLAIEYPLFGTKLSALQAAGIGLVTIGVIGITLGRDKEASTDKPSTQ